jgi:hypothetical protein
MTVSVLCAGWGLRLTSSLPCEGQEQKPVGGGGYCDVQVQWQDSVPQRSVQAVTTRLANVSLE